MGKCVNGLCPAGYACGAGDLCYAKSTGIVPAATTQPKSSPMAVRNRLKAKTTSRLPRPSPTSKSARRAIDHKTTPRVGSSSRRSAANWSRRDDSPENYDEQWQQGLVNDQKVLYDDYDGPKPFFNEELNLINAYNMREPF